MELNLTVLTRVDCWWSSSGAVDIDSATRLHATRSTVNSMRYAQLLSQFQNPILSSKTRFSSFNSARLKKKWRKKINLYFAVGRSLLVCVHNQKKMCKHGKHKFYYERKWISTHCLLHIYYRYTSDKQKKKKKRAAGFNYYNFVMFRVRLSCIYYYYNMNCSHS